MTERFTRLPELAEITLAYETFGDPADPTLLLVGGLTQQLIEWRVDLCRRFAAHGLHVVRFDHRDVGHSTKLDHLGVPDLWSVYVGQEAPRYTIGDMAGDAVGLLDDLGVARAHVLGTSMGGMIAQRLALDHPDRVVTLTSAQSTCGQATPDLDITAMIGAFVDPPPTREARIADNIEAWRWMAGPHFAFDDADARRRSMAKEDRCFHQEGRLRQLAAMTAAGDRTEELRSMSVPTLVLHGEIDPVISVEGGRRTAAAVPGARLHVFERMGHGFPRELWATISGLVADHALGHDAA